MPIPPDELASYATMRPLERREQLAGYAAAVLAAGLSLAIWLPHVGQHVHLTPRARAANSYTPTLGLEVGLGAALILATASLTRKRLFLAVVSLFTGDFGPWARPLIFGIPFFLLAGWQMLRWARFAGLRVEARRTLAEQNGDETGWRSSGRRGEARAAGSRQARTTRSADSAGARSRRTGAAASGPGRSRRYTPPKRSKR
ncbi:MAG: hypothetical protein M0Z87_06705 [Actinomycetota bacterium]|nr:hypothetical protein [Actinomycetota bacterium]